MMPAERELLRGMLVAQRLVALGVLADGRPVVGLLPFVASADFSALIVQASRLARHTRGLLPGAPFGAVIHRPDSAESDPLQIPRVSLEGQVDPLGGERPELQAAMRAYVARFPEAVQTLSLPDFGLYRLEIQSGRLVAGFGRALNLSLAHLKELAERPA